MEQIEKSSIIWKVFFIDPLSIWDFLYILQISQKQPLCHRPPKVVLSCTSTCIFIFILDVYISILLFKLIDVLS